MLNKDLGFKKDAIVYFGVNRNHKLDKRSLLLNKLRTIPGIARISLASDPPSSNGIWSSGMDYKDDKNVIHQEPQVKIGDTNYFPIFGLLLVAGNNITQSDTTNSLIINETLSRNLGFKDPRLAVGKQIDWDGKQRIVGVVADFHPQSLRQTIGPLVVANGLNRAYTFNLSLQPQTADGVSWTTTISKVEHAFKEVYPDDDFDYHFMDDTVAKFYTAEKNIEHLMYWATGLTIFISCLGLLGLAIYITNQRTKEIGIRKVIGATVTQIVVLISKDFMRLIGLAILIAMPIAWWGSNEWLKNFAYKTTLSWWVFAAGGAILIVIALFVLCLRAFRAASANPVTWLRAD